MKTAAMEVEFPSSLTSGKNLRYDEKPPSVHRSSGSDERPLDGKEDSPSKDKLWKVAQEFEAMFLYQMYKSMRKTVQSSEWTEPSHGREIFTDMLDYEYAKVHSGTSSPAGQPNAGESPRGAGSLAELVYKALSRDEGKAITGGGLKKPDFHSLRGFAAGAYGSVASATKSRMSPHEVDGWVRRASERFDVPENLIHSVIRQESNYDARAVSHAGAKGLMQLMDSTAMEMGVNDSFHPAQNVMGGTRYLRLMLDRFDGDLQKALAGYNAGPGAVERHGGIPPYPETQDYVSRVMERKRQLDAVSVSSGVGHGSPVIATE